MKNKKSFRNFIFLTKLLIFAEIAIFSLSPFVSCKSIPQESGQTEEFSEYQTEVLVPDDIHWEKICTGFEKTDFIVEGKISWTCVKIDLNTPGLQIINTPEAAAEKGLRFHLKDFASENDTIVAFNTTPFDNNTKTYLPIGIVVNEGELIYNPVNRTDYAALGFYKNEENQFRAKVLCPQLQVLSQSQKFDYAAGGFFLILQDNQLVPHKAYRRSRTAAGTDCDGRFLYVFAAAPFFNLSDNDGLTYNECALILKQLGCSDALQLDGGHSTGLVINSKTVEKPFFQRKIPAATGIKLNGD